MFKWINSKWVIGLFIILAIYTLYYLFFIESPTTILIPRKLRHVIKFTTTISVYLIGSFHLGRIETPWMSYLWHFVHLTLLFILVTIGVYDWFLGMVSQEVKDFTSSIQEFLISPVLYVGMGILNKRLKQI